MFTTRAFWSLLCLLLLVLLLAGCTDNSSVIRNIADFFPLAPGNQWTYTEHYFFLPPPGEPTQREITFTVAPETTYEGHQAFPIRINFSADPNTVTCWYYRWNPNGLLNYGTSIDTGDPDWNSTIFLSPGDLRLKSDLAVGSVWQVMYI